MTQPDPSPIPDHPVQWCEDRRNCPWHGGKVKIRAAFSFRYGVIGVYRDRQDWTVRVYPLPFVRLSVGRFRP